MVLDTSWMALETDLFVGGLVPYVFTFVWIWALVVWLFSIDRFRAVPFVWHKLPLLSPKTIFIFLISIFLVTRWIWLCLTAYAEDGYSDFIFNRIAFVLLFTAFSLIILFWAETLHMMWRNNGVKERKEGFYQSMVTRIIFFIGNGLIWVGQLAFIIAFVSTDDGNRRENVLAYDINIILIMSIFFLICVGFALYGGLLLFATRNMMDFRKKAAFYIQIILMTLILMACFGLRFALFLYRPITDEYLPKDIFQTFAYYFPELVPVFMLSTIIIWSRRRQIYGVYYLQKKQTAKTTKSKHSKSTDDSSTQLQTFSGSQEAIDDVQQQ